MCVASLRSMTFAIKAKNILEKNGINSEIIKLEPYMTQRGCAYGIKFDCVNLRLVKDALTANRVNFTEIISLP